MRSSRLFVALAVAIASTVTISLAASAAPNKTSSNRPDKSSGWSKEPKGLAKGKTKDDLTGPSPSPSTEPSPTSSPTSSPSPSQEPSPTASPSQEPSPEPSATTSPTPEPSPTQDPGTGGGSDPVPGLGTYACTGLTVLPTEDLEAIVAATGSGATFCLAPGVHRLRGDIDPKSGQTFIGTVGTILSGAKRLSGFTQSGSVWVVSGQTAESTPKGSCKSWAPRCSYNEVVFVDDVPQFHESSASAVGPGEFYFDYANDKIYLGSNPAGRTVEVAVEPRAFDGAAGVNNVTIKGMVIEKFASPAQQGAVDVDGGADWRIAGNVLRWNHGAAISIGPRNVVRDNLVHHNGQLGLHASGSDDVLVVNNEISYNNTYGFSYGWEAGGTKFVKTERLTVRGNYVHHNTGPGLWTDIDNIDTLYEDNTVEDNADAGIFHEISYDAIIRNNIVRRNGFDRGDWLWGAGIQIAASGNVTVTGNTLRDNANSIALIQQSRGSGAYGHYDVVNVSVRNNDVRMTVGRTGVVQDIGDSSVFSSRNLVFAGNTYRLEPGRKGFAWANSSKDAAGWKAAGNDTNGTFLAL